MDIFKRQGKNYGGKEEWILDLKNKKIRILLSCLLGLDRLQTEVNVKQHQISENEKLLQSLRTEIKVYEKLEEARKKGTGMNAQLSLYPLPLHLFPLNVLLSKASGAGSLFLCFCLCLLCKGN